MPDETHDYQSASDLFGNLRLIKKEGRPLDERATLIRYFCEKVGKEAKVVGIRLAHYELSDLYALKSGYEDRARQDNVKARKWWWWQTKTTSS